MKKQLIDTSIIIPAFDEAPIIANTLEQLAVFVAGHKEELGSTEVVVVAAGSDETATIARKYAARFDELQVIEPPARAGKGRDVRLGFLAANGAVQLFMDADVSTPLRHITQMVAQLRDGADIVIGARQLTKIHPNLFRTLFSLGSNWLTRLLLFPTIRDTQCGFKGFTKVAARQLFSAQKRDGWGFDVEVLQLAKERRFKVSQLVIDDWHETRSEDLRGDNLLAAGLRTLGDLVTVRFAAWGRSFERHWRWWVLLAMFASFALMLYIGLQQSVWFDEAYSIAVSQYSVSDLLHLTAVDVHPPLYYLLLKAWASVFGWGEPALRALSALFMSGAIGMLALVVKKLFNVKVALWAVLFVAFAPFLLRYGFEIRMYALAVLIALAGTYAMLSALGASGKRATYWWMAYAVLIALGVYTLYYTTFIWVAHLLWLSFTVRPRGQPFFKQPWMAAYAGAVALFVPWLPFLISQVKGSALTGVTEAIMVPQLTTIVSFSLFDMPHWLLQPWPSLALILLFIGIMWLVIRTFRVASKEQKKGLQLLLSYLLVPIALMLVISLPPLRPMFLERYISPFIISGYALLGVCVGLLMARQSGKKWPVGIVAVALLAAMAVGVVNLTHAGNYNYQRTLRPMAKQIAASITNCNDRLIIADDPMVYYELHYYLAGHCTLAYNSPWVVEYKGGFAPIYQNALRVYNTQAYSERFITLVFSGSGQPMTHLPPSYKLERVQNFDDYHIRYFQRSSVVSQSGASVAAGAPRLQE